MPLPREIWERIRAVPRGLWETRVDRIAWKYSVTGQFSTKSAHILAYGGDPLAMNESWEWVWKSPTHPRIIMFIWMAGHQKIPTNYQLHKRGMDISLGCPRCRNGVEDTSHALRDYPMAARVWRRIGIPQSKWATFSLPIFEWLRVNSSAYELVHMNLNWFVVFLQAVWVIWTSRNDAIFRSNYERKPLHLLYLQRAAEFQASLTPQSGRNVVLINV